MPAGLGKMAVLNGLTNAVGARQLIRNSVHFPVGCVKNTNGPPSTLMVQFN